MVVKYWFVADLTFKIKGGPACLCMHKCQIWFPRDLNDICSCKFGGLLDSRSCMISKFSIFAQVVCFISFISLTPNRRLGWQLASLEPASRSSGRDQSRALVRGGWLSSCPRQALANARCRFAKEPWWRKTLQRQHGPESWLYDMTITIPIIRQIVKRLLSSWCQMLPSQQTMIRYNEI